jgi:hypothetical protein
MKSLLAFALITANFSFVLAAPSLLKRSQRIIDPSCKDYQESIGGALTDALYYAQLGLDVLKLERSESQDDLLWALFAPSDLFGENVPIEIPTGVTKTSKISELVGELHSNFRNGTTHVV